MGAVFIELVVGAAYFGGLWTLSFSIGSCSVLIVTWEENFLTVRVTDWVSTRLLSHTISSRYIWRFLIVRRSWTWCTTILITCLRRGARFQIEISATVAILQCILAHYCCLLLFFCPVASAITSILTHVTAWTSSRIESTCSWRSHHTWSFRCTPICLRRIPSVLNLTTWHWRLTSKHILVVFHLLLLAEKEVLIALTSNLKI